ncbi:MAG: SGNH/GDSL hydrolase family protein [Clostridia bacterium]|nr:SGNH/GDSL hydrolase family protein [Clostridia bacterium]
MKKLLFLLMLMTVVLLFAACSGFSDTTTGLVQPQTSVSDAAKDTAETVVTTPETAPETAPETVSSLALSIDGQPLADYTIVYADSLYDPEVLSPFTTEHDFFRLIAEDLAKRLYAKTGVLLPCVRDTEIAVGKWEILVGPTNRSESDPLDALDVFKTYVKLSGKKLVVGAGYDSTPYTGNKRQSYCYASTYHAWDAVEDYLDKTMAEGISSLSLTADSDFSVKVDLIAVACIGDSITEGAGSTARDFHAYPAVLGRILWQDHLVVNLGNSGKTMRDDLGMHYRGTTQHAALRRYAPMYDYAFLMLGTNDSYYDRTWPASSDEKYLTSADNLVKELTFNNTAVEVIVMNCPMYYGTNGSGSAKVRALQAKLPSRFEAMGIKSSFFDMYTFTKEKVGAVNFPDQLHPNDTGHAMMAEELSTLLLQRDDGT